MKEAKKANQPSTSVELSSASAVYMDEDRVARVERGLERESGARHTMFRGEAVPVGFRTTNHAAHSKRQLWLHLSPIRKGPLGVVALA